MLRRLWKYQSTLKPPSPDYRAEIVRQFYEAEGRKADFAPPYWASGVTEWRVFYIGDKFADSLLVQYGEMYGHAIDWTPAGRLYAVWGDAQHAALRLAYSMDNGQTWTHALGSTYLREDAVPTWGTGWVQGAPMLAFSSGKVGVYAAARILWDSNTNQSFSQQYLYDVGWVQYEPNWLSRALWTPDVEGTGWNLSRFYLPTSFSVTAQIGVSACPARSQDHASYGFVVRETQELPQGYSRMWWESITQSGTGEAWYTSGDNTQGLDEVTIPYPGTSHSQIRTVRNGAWGSWGVDDRKPILGISVRFNWNERFSKWKVHVQLVKHGAPVGEEKVIVSDGWSNYMNYYFGSGTDLWGTTWEPEDFDEGFGVNLWVEEQHGVFTIRTVDVGLTRAVNPNREQTLWFHALDADGEFEGYTGSLPATAATLGNGRKVIIGPIQYNEGQGITDYSLAYVDGRPMVLWRIYGDPLLYYKWRDENLVWPMASSTIETATDIKQFLVSLHEEPRTANHSRDGSTLYGTRREMTAFPEDFVLRDRRGTGVWTAQKLVDMRETNRHPSISEEDAPRAWPSPETALHYATPLGQPLAAPWVKGRRYVFYLLHTQHPNHSESVQYGADPMRDGEAYRWNSQTQPQYYAYSRDQQWLLRLQLK